MQCDFFTVWGIKDQVEFRRIPRLAKVDFYISEIRVTDREGAGRNLLPGCAGWVRESRDIGAINIPNRHGNCDIRDASCEAIPGRSCQLGMSAGVI